MLDIIRSQAQSWGVKLAFGLIIIVFVFWGVGSFTGMPSTVAVTVNDQPITIVDLQRQVQQAESGIRSQYPSLSAEDIRNLGLPRQVIQQMILEALLTQEAERVGLFITPAELRAKIETIPVFQKDGVFDPGLYTQVLEAQGLTPGVFESQFSTGLLIEKLQLEVTAGVFVSEAEARNMFMFNGEERVLEYLLFPYEEFQSKVTLDENAAKNHYDANQANFVTPATADVAVLRITPTTLAPAFPVETAEAKAYYDSNTARFAKPEEVKARHIIILSPQDATPEQEQDARKRIHELANRLADGEDFIALAKEHSQDGSAADGGDLGWFTREQMVKAFSDAAFALKPGETSAPVRSEFGYHLIKTEEHRPASTTPFEEAEPTIQQLLAEEKAAGKMQEVLDEALTAIINGKPLQEAGTAYKLTPEQLGTLDTATLATTLGISAEDVARILTATAGTAIDSPFMTNNGYALVHVNTVTPEGAKPFDEVQEDIKLQLVAEKARQLAHDEAVSVRASLSAEANAPLSEELQKRMATAKPIGRDGQIPDMGQNQGLADAAFAAEQGLWLPVPFNLETGVVLARVKESIEPNEEIWNQLSAQLIDVMTTTKREQVYRAFVELLQSQSSVQVHNEAIFN